MGIPLSLLNDLKRVPRDTTTALLMRHAARHPISDPMNYAEAELTEEGIRTAEELGTLVSDHFSAGRLVSSPVGRCLATCEALARGAGWEAAVQIDERLRHEFMAPAWFLVERKRPPGPLPFQVRAALRLMLPVKEELPVSLNLPCRKRTEAEARPVLDVFVTHDTVLGAIVGSLLGAPVLGTNWPRYLEGVLLWRADERIHIRWRGEVYPFSESFERVE